VAKLTLKTEAAPHRVGQIPVTGFGAAIAVRAVPKSAMIVDEWPEGARQWLTSTWCAESSHARIQAAAKAIRAESDDVLTTFQNSKEARWCSTARQGTSPT